MFFVTPIALLMYVDFTLSSVARSGISNSVTFVPGMKKGFLESAIIVGECYL